MILLNYLLYYLIIIPISLLPFRILYIISDGLYLIIYKLIGYRKKVVLTNIRNSFPDKSAKEHLAICNKFYHHFCDLVMESLKIFTISGKEANSRMKMLNPEFIEEYHKKGQSIIMAGGHFNNWELFAVAIDGAIPHNTIAIYQPLTNKFFDDKMRSTRGKYGLRMISTKIVKRVFDEERANISAIIFGSDQSPSNPNNCYWMKFLNQDTGVLFGVEKYAREYNYPVVYGRINKVKRGYYTFEFSKVTDDPSSCKYGEITETFTRMLEKDIIQYPQYWLWSHRRWKNKRPSIVKTIN
jgi:Kdo2-lipid IVA lauroyltransferase/acyltransferase